MNEQGGNGGWGAAPQGDIQQGDVQRRDVQGAGGPGALPGPLLWNCDPPYRKSSGHVAVVLTYDNGGHTVLWPDRPRDRHNKPWLRQPRSVYGVALGRHVTRFELTLPTAGDAEYFQAGASVHWEVVDPVLVVRQQVWNVAQLVHDDLVEQLRYVSRRFRLTEAQRADEAVRAELDTARFELGSDLGLRTKVHVRIDLSERVVERIREGTGLDHQLDLTEKEHALNRRREQQQSELVRERARAFEDLLARGDEGRIAYFMAKDPEKAFQIEQHFAQERRQDEADRLGFLTRLIDAGLIERHDIREGVYEALQFLQQSGRSIGRTVSAALPQEPRARAELDPASTPRRRRPFWEEDGDDDAPGLEAASDERELDGDGELDGGEGSDVRRDERRDERPDVREPSSVESAEERAERTRDAERARGADDFADDFGAPRRGGRASDRFDDWGD